jgi:DNA-binding GntR family transcriptional regulator
MMRVPNPQSINRISLHEELIGRLQKLIINADLEPGTKVPEKQLCEQFGAWVTPVTVEEVEEVFPVLGALDALSGELACQNITDAEIDAVRDLHAQMIQSYKDSDLDAYFRTNQKIHHAILLAARNDTLTSSCQALSLRMQRARYLANMTQGRWQEAVQEHERILEFLLARDGSNLARTLMGHMNSKRLSVISWLQSEGSMKD